MDVGQIVSIAIVVVLVLLGLYFAQRGARRGIVKAAMTTGNLVLSAFLACFLSRDFTTIARDYVYPLVLFVMRLVGLGHIEEELAELESTISLIPLFLGVLITPFLFLLCFCIIRAIIGFILMFVYRPRRKTVDEEGKTVKVKRHVPVWSRICGAVVGVLNGVLLLAILLVPFTGYTNLVSNIADEYYSEIDTTTYSRESSAAGQILYFALEDYVSPINDNWFIKTSYSTVGRPMFNHMTSTAYGKSAFNLENEAIVGIRLLRSGVKFLSFDLTNLDTGEQSVEALHEVVDTLDDSVLMPEMAAAMISDLCDNWAYGEAMFGMERPDLGELFNPTFDVLLNIMATADGETLIEDLKTLVGMLDLLVEHEFFGHHHDSELLAGLFGENPTLLKDLMALFEANEHLAPMATEFKQLCLRAVAGSLDMENLELTGKLTDSINAYKDQPEQLSAEIASIVESYLGDQGIPPTVGEDAIDEVANAISREFAGEDHVTEEEVIDFVLSYAQGNFTEDQIESVVPGYNG